MGMHTNSTQRINLSFPASQARLKHGAWDTQLCRHINVHHAHTGSRDKQHEPPKVRLLRVSWCNTVLFGREDKRRYKADEHIKKYVWVYMPTVEYYSAIKKISPSI
jgi:hypothetical protein